ncbi:PAS domain-containing protein, partial [Singulisphaera rosea]
MYDDSVFAKAILETIREPLLVLDGRLHVVLANRSFYAKFQVTAEETEGRKIARMGDGQWNIPALISLLVEIIPREASFEDFEVDHDFPKLGRRVMLLNARKIAGEGDRPDMILLAFQDETARRTAEAQASMYAAELERSNRDLEDFAS